MAPKPNTRATTDELLQQLQDQDEDHREQIAELHSTHQQEIKNLQTQITELSASIRQSAGITNPPTPSPSPETESKTSVTDIGLFHEDDIESFIACAKDWIEKNGHLKGFQQHAKLQQCLQTDMQRTVWAAYGKSSRKGPDIDWDAFWLKFREQYEGTDISNAIALSDIKLPRTDKDVDEFVNKMVLFITNNKSEKGYAVDHCLRRIKFKKPNLSSQLLGQFETMKTRAWLNWVAQEIIAIKKNEKQSQSQQKSKFNNNKQETNKGSGNKSTNWYNNSKSTQSKPFQSKFKAPQTKRDELQDETYQIVSMSDNSDNDDPAFSKNA